MDSKLQELTEKIYSEGVERGKQQAADAVVTARWTRIAGYLRDTCLAAQGDYKLLLDYFKIKHKN